MNESLPPAAACELVLNKAQEELHFSSPADVAGRLHDIDDARLLGRPRNRTELAGSEGTAVRV